VLDTNTAVSGLLWHGAPNQLLAAKHKFGIRFFSCKELLDELAGILRRPKFSSQLAFLGTTPDTTFKDYCGLVTVVKIHPISPSISRDPDDDIVLAYATASNADLIGCESVSRSDGACGMAITRAGLVGTGVVCGLDDDAEQGTATEAVSKQGPWNLSHRRAVQSSINLEGLHAYTFLRNRRRTSQTT
jgi:putative PIN family toxin of toxin-antitoxin system